MRLAWRGAKKVFLAVGAIQMLIVGGCMKSDNPSAATGSGVPVSLAVSLSKGGGGFSLQKSSGETVVDSLRVDSVVVVVEKFRFLLHSDSMTVDPMGDDEHNGSEDDATITFRGPFVVRVRDTLAVDFASQVLPAGNYDGIAFVIHRLLAGENHEDSDDHDHHGAVHNDASIVGSSVVVWGAEKKNGEWLPFMLNIDLEAEFMIKGNFTVKEATGTVRIALNFDLALLFRDPTTGAFIDPLDSSGHANELIKRAIRAIFGHGHGGHDRHGDGHPDD